MIAKINEVLKQKQKEGKMAQIVKIDRPIRNNNAIANIKEMQKTNPPTDL